MCPCVGGPYPVAGACSGPGSLLDEVSLWESGDFWAPLIIVDSFALFPVCNLVLIYVSHSDPVVS